MFLFLLNFFVKKNILFDDRRVFYRILHNEKIFSKN